MTVAQVVELTGVVDVLGARLRPGAIAAFGAVRADELLDAVVPMSLGVSAEQLVAAADFPAQLRLVIGALRARVAVLGEPESVSAPCARPVGSG